MNSPFEKQPAITYHLADFRARCLVNGSSRHEVSGDVEPNHGSWSGRFKLHPWVLEAERDGWGRDLRMACIGAARDRILHGTKPNDIEPEQVMPKVEYIDHWRDQARKEREALAWRRANPDHKSIKGLSEIDGPGLLRRLGITKP